MGGMDAGESSEAGHLIWAVHSLDAAMEQLTDDETALLASLKSGGEIGSVLQEFVGKEVLLNGWPTAELVQTDWHEEGGQEWEKYFGGRLYRKKAKVTGVSIEYEELDGGEDALVTRRPVIMVDATVAGRGGKGTRYITGRLGGSDLRIVGFAE